MSLLELAVLKVKKKTHHYDAEQRAFIINEI